MSAISSAVNAIALPEAPIDSASYDEEATREHALNYCNRRFKSLDPVRRIEWALTHLPGNHVM